MAGGGAVAPLAPVGAAAASRPVAPTERAKGEGRLSGGAAAIPPIGMSLAAITILTGMPAMAPVSKVQAAFA